MSDSSDGPRFRNAAEWLVDKKRLKYESKHRALIDALSAGGHEPRVRVWWQTGEGGGARVSLVCDRCSRRRRLLVPERWQALSPDKPCEV